MQVHHRGCNPQSPGWEIVLAPMIRAWQALKPQADARLWRNETTEAEKTSPVHQLREHLCCTRERAANTRGPCPALHGGHSTWQWLRARSWTLPERYQSDKSLLCLLDLCSTLSEESVSLSSAADFAPRYKDSYCNISYSPSPPLAHPVPEVAKFRAVKVSLWLLRNLISEYDHSPSVLFRIFRDKCWVNP